MSLLTNSKNGAIPMLPAGAVVLFQGDSITDAGRDVSRAATANDPAGLGRGYAGVIGRGLSAEHADWKCYNRGISGNRIVDLLGRWERDALDLVPDLVSILIGVNDTWHRYTGGNGIPVPRYEVLYRMVLDDTRARLPRCRLVLGEPFVLPGGAFRDAWMPELRARMDAVHRLASEYGATLVPYQTMFEAEMKRHSAAALAVDGVHPTELGHALMARQWRASVGL